MRIVLCGLVALLALSETAHARTRHHRHTSGTMQRGIPIIAGTNEIRVDSSGLVISSVPALKSGITNGSVGSGSTGARAVPVAKPIPGTPTP